MNAADRSTARCASPKGRTGLLEAALSRTFVFCLFISINIGGIGIKPASQHGNRPSLLSYCFTWIAPAYADDEKSEAEKKAKERAREQAKKEAERAREQAKKAAERAREQAKKESERERERSKKAAEREREHAKKELERSREWEKQSLERQFEQEKKALEKSGASEDEKRKLEDRYERDKRALESDYSHKSAGPPATVYEFFKRKFRGRPKEPDDDERDSERHVKEHDDDDEQEAQRPVAIKRPLKRPVHGRKPPKTSFRDNEILAVNPGPRGRRLAEQLGFRVISSAHVSGVRGRVVRFATPPGLDARKARKLLRQKHPAGNFEFNRKYRVYHAARDTDVPARPDAPTPGKPTAPRSRAGTAAQACEADHCFSRSVLRWSPKLSSCSAGVRIGIIDTNVDLKHRTFRGQSIRIGNFIPAEQRPSADSHGTAVASILGGSRESSTPGLVPAADFFAANIFYTDENGQPATDTMTLLRALDWLDAWNVQLVNMSFVGPEDRLIQDALQRMSRKHMIFIAATGNEGPSAPPRFPAAYPEVIAVTAVDSKLRSYRRANRGSFVDVAAPGVKIWTALPGDREGYQSGTSFATPHVTALLATIYKSRPTENTRDQLMEYLPVQDLGSPGRDPVYGRGLVMAPPDCRGTDRRHVPTLQTATSAPGKTTAAPLVAGAAGLSWAPTLSRRQEQSERQGTVPRRARQHRQR